jgi:cholesterol transport system auxiliary component
MINRMLRAQRLCRFGLAVGLPARRTVRLTALAGALVVLSSCSVLPKAETLEIYQLLSASIAPSAQANSLPWTLRIATPRSNQVTDSVRVLVLQQSNRISAYKGVRWSDPAPVLLRNRLAAAFRTDGRLGSVSSGNDNLPANLELGGDLSAFQVEYRNGISAVNIQFYATLVQFERNGILATRSFEIIQSVEGRGIPEVIAAFGKATDKLATEIIEWTLQYGPATQSVVK